MHFLKVFQKNSCKSNTSVIWLLSWENFEDFASNKVLKPLKRLKTQNDVFYGKFKIQKITLKFYLSTECVNKC